MRQKRDKRLSRWAIWCISCYQLLLSPDTSLFFRYWLKGRICSHHPHCSAYARECFERYPFFTAFHYTMERVSHCVPRYDVQYDPSVYRVVFFSSAPIGVPFLEQIAADKRFELVWVVTMPDAPVGRWMHMSENIIKQTAKSLCPEDAIRTPRSLRLDSKKYAADAQEFQDRVHVLSPDFFVVIAYGHIMPQWVLDIPHFGAINVHGSLLPAYRGASPLQSVFLDGKSETGITVMHMDAGVDTGDMISSLSTNLPLHWTVRDLIEWIKASWPAFLQDTLWKRGKWVLIAQPQEETLATMCRKIEKEDGLIDPWHEDLLTIWQKWQAFALRPKLYFFIDQKRISIDMLTLVQSTTREQLQGNVLFSNREKKTELNSCIADIRFIPEGKKPLTREQFMHWYLRK